MAGNVLLTRPCVNHLAYFGRPDSPCPHCGAEDDIRIPLKPKFNLNRGNRSPEFFAMEMRQFTKLWRDAVLKETSSYVKAWLDSILDSVICSRYGTSTFQVRTQGTDSHGVEHVHVPVSVSWDANSDSDDAFSRSYVYLGDSDARIDGGGGTDPGADGRPSFDYERSNSNTGDRTSSASTATYSGSYGQLLNHPDSACPRCGAEDDIRIPLKPKFNLNRGNGRPEFFAMEISQFTKLWRDAVFKETSSNVKAWLESIPDSEICFRYGMSTFQVRTQGTESHGVENVPVPVSVSWDANSDSDNEFSRSYVYLGDSDARIDGGGRTDPRAVGRPSFDYERTNSNAGDGTSSSSNATNSGSYRQLPGHPDSLTLRMVSGGTRWLDPLTNDPHTAFRGPMYVASPVFSQTISAAGSLLDDVRMSGRMQPAANVVRSGGSNSFTQLLHTSIGGTASGTSLATVASNSGPYARNISIHSAPNAAFTTGSRGMDSVPPSAAFGMRPAGNSGQPNSVHESVRYPAPRSTYLTDRVVLPGYPHGPYHTLYDFGDVWAPPPPNMSAPFNPYTWTWTYPTPYHHGPVPPHNHVHENRAPGLPNNEGQAHHASVYPHNHEHMHGLSALPQANGPEHHISAPSQTHGQLHRTSISSQARGQPHRVSAPSQTSGQTHNVSVPSNNLGQARHVPTTLPTISNMRYNIESMGNMILFAKSLMVSMKPNVARAA